MDLLFLFMTEHSLSKAVTCSLASPSLRRHNKCKVLQEGRIIKASGGKKIKFVLLKVPLDKHFMEAVITNLK